MKSRPILFSTPMIQAILAGRKTMTRRIVKPQPELYEVKGQKMYRWSSKTHFIQSEITRFMSDPYMGIPCPYGEIGDELWVRETFVKGNSKQLDDKSILYWCFKDGAQKYSNGEYHPGFGISNDKSVKWKPSIFMPRAASRITLKITEINVERLQEITEEDAKAEGVTKLHLEHSFKKSLNYKNFFQVLWQKINGPESWNANPFVWVISFEKL